MNCSYYLVSLKNGLNENLELEECDLSILVKISNINHDHKRRIKEYYRDYGISHIQPQSLNDFEYLKKYFLVHSISAVLLIKDQS